MVLFMIPATIKLDIDERQLKQLIEDKLNQQLTHQLIFVDIEGLMKMTSMKLSFIEEHLLNTPQVKQWERRRSRKRFWKMPDVLNSVMDVVDQWD